MLKKTKQLTALDLGQVPETFTAVKFSIKILLTGKTAVNHR